MEKLIIKYLNSKVPNAFQIYSKFGYYPVDSQGFTFSIFDLSLSTSQMFCCSRELAMDVIIGWTKSLPKFTNIENSTLSNILVSMIEKTPTISDEGLPFVAFR